MIAAQRIVDAQMHEETFVNIITDFDRLGVSKRNVRAPGKGDGTPKTPFGRKNNNSNLSGKDKKARKSKADDLVVSKLDSANSPIKKLPRPSITVPRPSLNI